MKALVLIAAMAFVVIIGELAHLQLLAAVWIPGAMLLFLVGFPLFAVVGKSDLFWGLFDLDLSPRMRLPIRNFVATLSAFAVAGSAASMADLALRSGPERMGISPVPASSWLAGGYMWLQHLFGGQFVLILVAVNALSAYFGAFAVATSWSQDRQNRPIAKLIGGLLAAMVVGSLAVLGLFYFATPMVKAIASATQDGWFVTWLGPGYRGTHWAGHLGAFLACLLALTLYAALGLYGKRALGKAPTVAAVVAPLMVVLVLGWIGSGTQFFLSRWHIPLLLVVAVLAWINGMLPWADHTYELVPRNKRLAAKPYEVLTANDRSCAILVASAGGGIQAAAWTAKVLQELHCDLKSRFDRALCLISSISGGSMGSACYVDWLERGAPQPGVLPFNAAAASSLDEVAWGLAWPDLLRVVLPFPIKMDRAEALERAWIGNAGTATLGAPLSSWNATTAKGNLPALIMNSTMVEAGGPLLLGTSDVNGMTGRVSDCWWDGDKLHVFEGAELDIPIVRGARLSATFPFVTPAARPVRADHEPHMMDGGFYDNYGMATLTEWIDQALEEQEIRKPKGEEQVKRVLVLQINGFPPAKFDPPKPPSGRGGWLRQLIDPILILVNVRTAGQVSHRDVELDLLQDKWSAHGIQIEHVNFELEKEDAPLSWHLMPKQKQAIAEAWTATPSVVKAREAVARFLDGCPPSRGMVREEAMAGGVATEAGSSA